MKKTLWTMAAAALISTVGAMAGEKLVAEWNFDDGLVSNGIKLNCRGSAALVDEEGRGKVLNPSTTRDGQPAGVILAGATRKELLPAVFSWSMDIKYIAPDPLPPKGIYSYLLDCKYATKEGLSIMMNSDAKGNLRLNVSVGTENGLCNAAAKAPVLADGQWHNVKVTAKYPKMEILIDDKSIGTYVLNGEILPPKHRLTIGDRVASIYNPFYGLIDNVKLTTEEE